EQVDVGVRPGFGESSHGAAAPSSSLPAHRACAVTATPVVCRTARQNSRLPGLRQQERTAPADPFHTPLNDHADVIEERLITAAQGAASRSAHTVVGSAFAPSSVTRVAPK